MSRLAPLLALSLAACSPAPPAASPAPPTPAAPHAPATYAVSFVYEPTLTLKVLRDGRPFDGEATLVDEGASEDRPLKLAFTGGQATFDAETLGLLLRPSRGWALQLDERRVSLTSSGATNPFACHQKIDELRRLDPCSDPPPPEDTPLALCDSVGTLTWQRLHAGHIEQADRCWSSLDDATLKRLASLSSASVAAFACGRLVAIAGPDAPLDVAVKLAPRCLPLFPAHRRRQIDDEAARRQLPAQLAAARQGSQDTMLAFYARYRTLDPARAEEIRKLAAKQFGPAAPERWFALRTMIESLRSGDWHASLCESTPTTVTIAVNESEVPRYFPSAPPDLQPLTRVSHHASPYDPLSVPRLGLNQGQSQRDRVMLIRRLHSIFQARGRGEEVRINYPGCEVGFHWYFAHVEKP